MRISGPGQCPWLERLRLQNRTAQYPKGADKSTIKQSENTRLNGAYAACQKGGKILFWITLLPYTKDDKCIVDGKQIKAAEEACTRAVKDGTLTKVMTLAEAKEKDPEAFNDLFKRWRFLSVDYDANLIPFQETHNYFNYYKFYQYFKLNHGTERRTEVKIIQGNGIGGKTYCDFRNNTYDENNLKKQSPAFWVCFDEGTRKIKMVYSLPAYITTALDACYNGDDQINAFIKDCTEKEQGYANLLPLKDTELSQAYPLWASNPSQPLAQAMGSWKGVSTSGEIKGAYSVMDLHKK
jgi:hypothetical protein